MVRIKRTAVNIGDHESVTDGYESIKHKRVKQRCNATTAKGRRCKRWEGKYTLSGMCYHHDHMQTNKTAPRTIIKPSSSISTSDLSDDACINHSWEGIDLNQAVNM